MHLHLLGQSIIWTAYRTWYLFICSFFISLVVLYGSGFRASQCVCAGFCVLVCVCVCWRTSFWDWLVTISVWPIQEYKQVCRRKTWRKKGKEVSQLIVPSQFIGDHLKSFNSSAKNVMEQHHQMECPNNPEMEWRALEHIRNTATPTHKTRRNSSDVTADCLLLATVDCVPFKPNKIIKCTQCSAHSQNSNNYFGSRPRCLKHTPRVFTMGFVGEPNVWHQMKITRMLVEFHHHLHGFLQAAASQHINTVWCGHHAPPPRMCRIKQTTLFLLNHLFNVVNNSIWRCVFQSSASFTNRWWNEKACTHNARWRGAHKLNRKLKL